MHSIKIINTATQYLAVENGDVLIVTVEVKNGDKGLGVRKFTYPLDTKEEDILADLRKMKATLDSDHEVGLKSKKLEDGLKNAKKLQKSLTDVVI